MVPVVNSRNSAISFTFIPSLNNLKLTFLVSSLFFFIFPGNKYGSYFRALQILFFHIIPDNSQKFQTIILYPLTSEIRDSFQ